MDNLVLHPKSALNPFLTHAKHEGNPLETGVMIRENQNFLLASLTAFNDQQKELSASIFSAFGIQRPKNCKVERAKHINFISIAPHQWLIYCHRDDNSDFIPSLKSIVGPSAAIVDLSDARAIIQVSGSKAIDTLTKGISIDLHPDNFTNEHAASTFAAHLGMTIWKSEDSSVFNISVFRAFSSSTLEWLITSASEFGCEIQV